MGKQKMADVLQIIEEKHPKLHNHITQEGFPKIHFAKYREGLFYIGIERLGYSMMTAPHTLVLIGTTPGATHVTTPIEINKRQSYISINENLI